MTHLERGTWSRQPALGASALALATLACRAVPLEPQPAPLVPANLVHDVRSVRGTVLQAAAAERAAPGTATGTEERATDAPGEAPEEVPDLDAHVRWIAVARRPTDFDAALSAATRLVFDVDLAEPLLATSRLARGAGVLRGERARALLAAVEAGTYGSARTAAEGSLRLPAVAPPDLAHGPSRGIGLVVEVRASEDVFEPDNFLGEYAGLGAVEKRLAVHVSRDARAAEPFELGFRLAGVARPRTVRLAEPLARGERPADALHAMSEVVVLREPPRPGEPCAVVFESPFESASAEAWIAWIELEPAGHEPPPEPPASEPAEARESEPQVQRLVPERVSALRSADDPRAALSFLAQYDGPSLAEDLALFADVGLLRELLVAATTALETGLEPEADPFTHPRRAWLVDQATYLALAARMTAGDVDPAGASAITAVLLRHTGEAGRYPSTIESVARASSDRAAFELAIVGENLIFLADRNPGARVRAYDWLAERDAAPPDYDPLAAEDERRAALETFQTAPAPQDVPLEPAGQGSRP